MILKKNAYPDLKRDLQFYPLGIKMPKYMSQCQIDTYNSKGYLFPIKIFNKSEIIDIREYFDDLLNKVLNAGWNSYEIINWHKHCRGIYDIVTDSRIINIIQDFLGDSIILRHSHFFVKLPGDGKRISWHQDASYWPLSKSRVISAWLAIDDVDLENAAMKVIPGSHLNNQLPFQDSQKEENNVLTQTVVNAEKHGEKPVSIELNAGEISLHSDWILHSSNANYSKKRRCGLAMRFLSKDVKAYNGWNVNSIICRGDDPSGHWENHPRPQGEYIPKKSDSFKETTEDALLKNN